MNPRSRSIDDDWYRSPLPENIAVGDNVYIDTAYGFAPFLSRRTPGLVLGDGCGLYDRTTLSVGPNGQVNIGAFTCLNGTYLVCNDRVTIGEHCLLAWGVLLTDSWIGPGATIGARAAALHAAALHPDRYVPPPTAPRPVTLEDNVWVGFGSVVLPGVTLGHGCIVGCKSIVSRDIPPYAVAVGDPPRIVRYLDRTDTETERARAFRECLSG